MLEIWQCWTHCNRCLRSTGISSQRLMARVLWMVVGGTVKRVVHNAIMARSSEPEDAREFAECAKLRAPGITSMYESAQEVENEKPIHDKQWQETRSIPGMHKVHCVRSVKPHEVRYGRISRELPGTLFRFKAVTVVSAEDLTHVLPIPAPQPVDLPTPELTGPHTVLPQLTFPPTASGPQPAAPPSVPTPQPGHWYAVYWEDNMYWFLGRCLEVDATVQQGTFEFLHQTTPELNQFKQAGDVDSTSLANVFFQVQEDPKPRSTSRSSYLKISDKEFQEIVDRFRSNYVQ